MSGLPEDEWRTAEVVDAELELDAAIDEVYTSVREARSIFAEIEADPLPGRPDYYDFLNGRKHTPEWDAVLARIDSGELTREALHAGEYADDPGVQAAFASQASYTEPDDDEDEPPAVKVDDLTYFEQFRVNDQKSW